MSSLAEIAQRYALDPVHNHSPHYEELLFWHNYYSNLRAAIIEECARAAELYLSNTDHYCEHHKGVAAAIRKLKDKP